MPPELEHQILEFIHQVYTTLGWPGVVLLMAIETVFFPIPSEVVMPLAAWMLGKAQGHGPAIVLVAGFWGALGSTIGAVGIYLLGAWGRASLLQRYGRYLLISEEELQTADRWFARYGQPTVFFARLIPIVRSFISLPAGVARMPFLSFLLLSFAGSYLWSTALAYGGYLLGEHWERLRAFLRPFDYPVLAALALLLALYIYRHVRRSRPAKAQR